jgi:3-oxoacyl-(acyl-carrier-protein) synthase/surfactin synthase thioesterase subunit/acyl carrier protein
VHGTVNLDRASAQQPLEFFVMCSSLSGALGNVGQCDYALANAFMDRYAQYRQGLVAAGERCGRTVSIGWPLWEAGGMQIEAPLREHLKDSGLAVLPSEVGVQLLYEAWRSSQPHVIVMYGERARLRASFGLAVPPTAPPERAAALSDTAVIHTAVIDTAPSDTAVIDAGAPELLRQVQNWLVREIGELLHIRIEEIDIGSQFGEFGFDSITLTRLANRLQERCGIRLAPMLFFEHPTPERCAQHLVSEHTEQLSRVLTGTPRVQSQEVPRVEPQPPPPPPSSSERNGAPEPIAIIGMSGCFPQAADIERFWAQLQAGRDCIGEVPAQRWDWRALGADEEQTTPARWGGFIEGVEQFDPLFFGISPHEARLMDPQQRLLLMHVWQAMEEAGYASEALSGSRTGVFIGTGPTGYAELLAQAATPIEGHSSTGLVASVGPNRVSYLLNLRGPSEPIETSCSSSLVAIHRAVRAIRAGECELAFAGGVNTLLSPWLHMSLAKAGMLSPHGRCKTFSSAAQGYVRGEGVGVLLLKPLSAAERDGDHIHGLIRASSENHGGRASSLTAPNPQAQAELIVAAVREARIDPRTIGYIEAHGTGTPLGDPIEVNALKSAFAQLSAAVSPTPWCGIGSVKTNIGHLEMAAGVAGVIKVLCQLEHRELVPSLHCEPRNPYIELSGSPFYIVQENQPWRAPLDQHGRELPRRAGVSSFGFGGVNAHLVLEEYRGSERPASQTPRHPALIVLSAKSDERLTEQVRQLLRWLETHAPSDRELHDIAYTLQVGRDAMEHRLATSALTVEELREKLDLYLQPTPVMAELYHGEVKRNAAVGLLNADEDLRGTVATWIGKGKYARLLELWVSGGTVEWQQLHRERKVRRVTLPTYPFAPERYWPDVAASLPSVQQRPTHSPLDAPFEQRLKEALSEIVGLPVESIDDARPLSFYGVDSIATLRLVNAIRHFAPAYAWPKHLAAKDLTLAQLAAHSGASVHASHTTDERGIRCLKPAANATARLLVFHCFAFGPGSMPWLSGLRDDVEVWSVGATDIATWGELVQTLAEGIRELFDRPVVLWGHSMGAIVAFEVLHYLERQHQLRARHVVLSASPPPSAFARMKYSTPFYDISANLDERELEVRLLEHQLIVPRSLGVPLVSTTALRNDVRLIQSYESAEGRRLSSPLCIVHATHDALVGDPSVLEQWSAWTAASSRCEHIEGTHLFFINPPRSFISILQDSCCTTSEASCDESPRGLYRLKSMCSGSQDAPLFPLGSDPRGYIIYAEDGHVAAHIWHARRPVADVCDCAKAEQFLTYIAYCGRFSHDGGAIDHKIIVSVSPELEERSLRRYRSVQGNELTLSTSAVVMKEGRQHDYASYQKLLWESCEATPLPQLESLVGSWTLKEIDGMQLDDGALKGLCIVSGEGYVSLMLSNRERPNMKYKNPALASDEEIELALRTCVAWLVRLPEHPAGSETLVYQAPFASDLARLSCSEDAGELQVTWPVQRGAEESLIQSRWVRTAPQQESQVIAMSGVTRIDARLRSRTHH